MHKHLMPKPINLDSDSEIKLKTIERNSPDLKPKALHVGAEMNFAKPRPPRLLKEEDFREEGNYQIRSNSDLIKLQRDHGVDCLKVFNPDPHHTGNRITKVT